MTDYGFSQSKQSYRGTVRQAKARRQAVLQRVWARRAVAYKRTVADWMQAGLIIRASELKRRGA